MSPPPIPWSALRRGAVLAPNWLGDAAMALPALRALAAGTPGCHWTVLGRAATAPLFALAGWPSLVLANPPALAWPASLAGCEIVVVLPNSWHSALLARRSGARWRLGYQRDGRGWLLSHAIAPPPPGALPGHESFVALELLRRAGAIAALPPDDAAQLRFPIVPPPGQVAAWRQRLAPGGTPLVAIHAGASFGVAKCWLPDRFAQLAARLAAAGTRVALIGARSEHALAEQVRAGHPGIENLAGATTLAELAALLAACDRLYANDSGPMHLAAAVGTPVTAIFGSTNEHETYPLAAPGGLRIVTAAGVACRPCKLRTCPIDHRCMTRISVDMVLDPAPEPRA